MNASGSESSDTSRRTVARNKATQREQASAAGSSREFILRAARRLFAEKGFQGVSVRAIAKEASVDPGLVHYFYPAKADVFAAAVGELCDTSGLFERIQDGPEEDRVERLVTTFLRMWEEPTVREPLLAVARSAVNNDEANRALGEFVREGLVQQVVLAAGVEEPELRGTLVTSQLMGTVLMRHVIAIEPLASADLETVAAHLNSAIHWLFTCDLTAEPPRSPAASA
ncbi:TetR family transcriptional regulator [Actinomadura sp. 9N215]|uniref:TetR/AcrR family transcriptional regulator n=1 Tax=Actinomadura sp. 9N215 TaxID=3375150 RepID=UPI0037BB01E2